MDKQPEKNELLEEQRDEVSVCPVHGAKLCLGQVPINYGLPMVDDDDRQAWKLFPFANEYVSGGCCIEAETRAEVKYCPVCRSEQTKWRRERKNAHLREARKVAKE